MCTTCPLGYNLQKLSSALFLVPVFTHRIAHTARFTPHSCRASEEFLKVLCLDGYGNRAVVGAHYLGLYVCGLYVFCELRGHKNVIDTPSYVALACPTPIAPPGVESAALLE